MAPPTTPGPVESIEPAAADDGVATIIPYRNLPALFAYYCGVFALLPLIGLLPAVIALVLGVIGVHRRAKNPRIKGAVHAWIGIILGGLLTLIWGFVLAAFVMGTMRP